MSTKERLRVLNDRLTTAMRALSPREQRYFAVCLDNGADSATRETALTKLTESSAAGREVVQAYVSLRLAAAEARQHGKNPEAA